MEQFEYRSRPKSNYIMEATWQELYKLAEHWKNELAFYKDEIRFFKKLSAKYNYIKNPKFEELKQRVDDAELQLKILHAQTEEHLKHITQFIKMLEEGQETDNEDHIFREEHNLMEDNIMAFANAFWQLRKAIFTEAEQYI